MISTKWGETPVAILAGRSAWLATILVLAVLFCLAPALSAPAAAPKFCSNTAALIFESCDDDADGDQALARAICLNVSDDTARAECLADAVDSRREARTLCREQLDGRRDACQLLGEGRYDPAFEPSMFDANFANLMTTNPYFPLGINDHWEYQSATEFDAITILNKTKNILGVTCIVARDQVMIDGHISEDTDDWYAQAKSGDVFYCGEEVKDYEIFAGDNPMDPELVSIDGSFKWGREGDKGGVIFPANPTVGLAYREEASLGNAEDVTIILSTTYDHGDDMELDMGVPKALADHVCANDCVVTKNFSLLEPGIFARKYYAKGVGLWLEVDPFAPEVLQLAACNVDPKCVGLPPVP